MASARFGIADPAKRIAAAEMATSTMVRRILLAVHLGPFTGSNVLDAGYNARTIW